MKKLKLLPLLFLALLCACLLTGCGKNEDDQVVEAPESSMVYTASFSPVIWKGENSLEPLAVTEQGFYASCYEQDPENEGEYRQVLYFVDKDREVRKWDYQQIDLPENEEKKEDYQAGSYLQRIFVLPEGELVTLETVYRSWSEGEGEEDQHWENSSWIRRLDAEGRELSAAPLEWEADSEYSSLDIYYAVMDPEGRVWVSGEEQILAFAEDGSCVATVDLGEWTNSLLCLPDGSVGAVTWGRQGPELLILDPEKGVAGRRISLEEYPEQIYPGSGGYSFYYGSGAQLYGYDADSESTVELVNLMDCDLTADQLRFLRAEEDGSFSAIACSGTELNLVTLRQVPLTSVAEKQTLTLGVLYPEMVSEAVIRFNRQHQDVRIEIVDYSQYADANTEEEAMEGLSRLTTEIMAGNMPDLLALEAMPFDQLAAKGLLEDLYPWIDGDPGLSREDFIPSVMQASEMDGKLYQAAPGFAVHTLIGASDVVGEEPGWTFDEMEAALAAMPEGCSALDPYMARDSVLMMLLFMDMKSYVNWSEANCDFENDDFYKLLRFCASFPAEPDYSSDTGPVTGRIASGKQMLMDATIYDLDEICYNDQYFGGSCTYIGYPTRSGSGNVLMFSSGYAMSANCRNKEAAWDFLRSFLTPEYQREQYGLPVRRDVLDEKIKAAAIEYEKDEHGEYRLDEEGNRIPISRGGMGMSDEYGNMVEFQLYGLTDEQISKFLHVIETIDKSVDLNSQVYSIVKQEAAAFFAGQKSPEEVAKLIQTKVSLYLGEQG